MPAQLPLRRRPVTASYPAPQRRVSWALIGAAFLGLTTAGCGRGGLEPGTEDQESELTTGTVARDAGPADAGTPNPNDFMAGGIAEYPPGTDGGQP